MPFSQRRRRGRRKKGYCRLSRARGSGKRRLFLFLLLPPVAGVLLALGVTRAMQGAGEEGISPLRGERTAPSGERPFVTEAPAQQSYGLLLCGIDHTRTLADVILYARLNLEENRAWILQIPRDLYVDPSGATGKINGTCLPFGSDDPTERIAGILKSQLGLEVDGAAAITLAGVRALVDAVGGVELTLDHEIDYLPGKVIPAGVQTIGGEQAEWLLRYRAGYRMGDLDRLKVQKEFLFAAMRSVQRLGRMETLRIAAENMGHVKTTVAFSEIASLLERALALTPERVSIEQIPTYGVEHRGLSVLCVNRFKLAEALNAGVRSDHPVDPWELHLVYPPQEEREKVPDEPQPEQGMLLDFSWDFPDEGEEPLYE